MKIGYLQGASFIDYPSRIAAVVFTQGCNFRCPYCHNPELVLPDKYTQPLDNRDVFTLLRARHGKLDAVVITGGEPCLQAGIEDFIAGIKDLGYFVKLDTNGTFPQVLSRLLSHRLLDYVAMDIKAPLAKYPAVTAVPVSADVIAASVAMIMRCAPAYEFRTTAAPAILDVEDFESIADFIDGAARYAIQEFVSSKHVSPDFNAGGRYSEEDMHRIRACLENRVGELIIR